MIRPKTIPLDDEITKSVMKLKSKIQMKTGSKVTDTTIYTELLELGIKNYK